MAAVEIREYHDDERIVIIRDDGGNVSQRPYTDEENADADARAALVSNEDQLNNDARTTIDTLLATMTAIQAVIDKVNTDLTAGDMKDLARALQRVTRQVLRLSRIQLKVLDTPNVG